MQYRQHAGAAEQQEHDGTHRAICRIGEALEQADGRGHQREEEHETQIERLQFGVAVKQEVEGR